MCEYPQKQSWASKKLEQVFLAHFASASSPFKVQKVCVYCPERIMKTIAPQTWSKYTALILGVT